VGQVGKFLLQTHKLKTDAPENKWCIRIRFSVMIENYKTYAL